MLSELMHVFLPVLCMVLKMTGVYCVPSQLKKRKSELSSKLLNLPSNTRLVSSFPLPPLSKRINVGHFSSFGVGVRV